MTTGGAAPDAAGRQDEPTYPSQDGWARLRIPATAALVALAIGVGVGQGATTWVVLTIAAVLATLVALLSERGILHALALAPFVEGVQVGPLSIGRLMAVAIVVVLFLRLVSGRLHIPLLRPITWLPATAVVLVIVASGLWATHFTGWTFEVGQIALAVAFFTAFALLVSRPEHVSRLLTTYVLGATFAGVWGLVQALTEADARAVGLQGDANIFALYQVAALPAALALARESSGARRVAWLVTLLPIIASVFASESRGALLALGATAFVLAALDRRRRVLIPLAVVVSGAAMTIVGLLNSRYSVERVAADRASGRIDLWHVAVQTFLDHPWIGIGSGNFKPRSIDLLTTEPGVELVRGHLLVGDGSHVHNIYLETLAEGGILGFTVLLVFLGATAWNLFVASQRHRSAAVAALMPMLVAFCSAAFFLSILNSKLLWMLAGLAAALRAMPGRSTDRARSPIPAEHART